MSQRYPGSISIPISPLSRLAHLFMVQPLLLSTPVLTAVVPASSSCLVAVWPLSVATVEPTAAVSVSHSLWASPLLLWLSGSQPGALQIGYLLGLLLLHPLLLASCYRLS